MTEDRDTWAGAQTNEAEVRREVEALEAKALADTVSSVLASTIDRCASELSARDTPASMRETALVYASIRAFRTVRAAINVISVGYPLEAEPYTRILLELFQHAKAVIADSSDAEARAWLNGERGHGISRRVKKAMNDKSVYAHLSQTSHGDARALARALTRRTPSGFEIEWGPRRTDQTEQQLRVLALAAREFSVLLEEVGFGEQPHLDVVDQALEKALPGWRPDAEWQQG
jgi:hypothetical protein